MNCEQNRTKYKYAPYLNKYNKYNNKASGKTKTASEIPYGNLKLSRVLNLITMK